MELETEANPAPEDDTRPLETEAEAETDELDNETDGEPEVETIEVERGGVKYTIPKALEGELLMQSDYTKKTMTLAEEKKATEAEITAKREAIALREANVDLHANIKTLEAQKRQLEAIPGDRIQRLRAEDPAEYNRLVGDYQAVQTALANAKDQQTALHNELTSRAERAIATSHEKAIEEAARTIPDFLTRRPELEKIATEIGGYTDLKQASAGDYRLLDLVAEGLKARESRAKAAKQQTAATAQPAAEIVKGRTPVTRPLDDRASTAAWMKARNEQAAKR
jgi:hypothetical protein